MNNFDRLIVVAAAVLYCGFVGLLLVLAWEPPITPFERNALQALGVLLCGLVACTIALLN